MMLKNIKKQVTMKLDCWKAAVLVGLLGAVLLESVVQITLQVASRTDPSEATWVGMAGVGWMIGAGFTMVGMNVVTASTGFSMAVVMGSTRRGYFWPSLLVQLVGTFAVLLCAYPVSWVSEMLRRAFVSQIPPDGESFIAANPALVLFHDYFWVVPLIALGIVAFGMAAGGLLTRFGRVGFWIVWVIFMFFSLGMPQVAEVESGPLYTACEAVLAATVGFGPAHWAAVIVALALIVIGAAWAMLRRACVK